MRDLDTKCPDLGMLRALIDDELPDGQRQKVQEHAANCKTCREDLRRLGQVSLWSMTTLSKLDPATVPEPNASLRRLQSRLETDEKSSGLARFGITKGVRSAFALQRYRLAAAALAVVLALSVALSYPPVRTAAEGFLTVFRVQRFEAVPVDVAKMPDLPAPKDVGEFTFVREPEIRRDVTLDEARNLVGTLRTPSRLPSGLLPTPAVVVSGESEAAFTVDLKKVKAYLSSIGAPNVNLPPELDGATIKANVPPQVGLIYSDKALADLMTADEAYSKMNARILFVAQGRGPVAEAPANIDIEQLRNDILSIPGLPADFVASIRGVQDLTHTLLVPVAGGSSTPVKVDGSDGLLVTSEEQGVIVVMWQKSDVLYAVGGNFSQSEILEVANSLK